MLFFQIFSFFFVKYIPAISLPSFPQGQPVWRKYAPFPLFPRSEKQLAFVAAGLTVIFF